MNKQTIELDVSKSHSSVCIRVGQGDVGGTTIEALIRDGGADIDLSGCAVYLVARLPDGSSYYRGRCPTSGASATIEVDESRLCSVSGYTDEAYFTVEKGGRIYSTGRFSLDIERSALDGQRPAQSWDDAVQELIDRGGDAAEAAEKAASDATAAKDAALTAANRAEGILAQLPLPDGNILRGEASGTLAHAEDAYAAPPLGLTVYGASVQDGTPSPDAPKPIASVTEAALKVCGKNICSDDELTNVNWAKSLPEIARMINRLKDRPVSIAFTATLVSAYDETKVPNSMFGMIVKGRKIYADQKPWGDGARIGTTKTIVYSFTVAPDDEITNVWAYGCGNSNDSSQRTDGRANISIQIELGTAATAYEPYQGSNLAIDLAGHELCGLPDGVRDELRIDALGNVELVKRTWKLQKRIGDMNNAENYPGWVIPFSEMTCPLESGYDAQITGFSTHFHRFYGRYIESQTEWLIYTMNIGMTESELVARYPDEVVTLVGELATPEVIPLGAVELPTLPAPVLNAWVESDVPTECAVEYVRDVNVVIAKLEEKLAAVEGAVSMLDEPTVIPELGE